VICELRRGPAGLAESLLSASRRFHHPVAADWFGNEANDILFCRVTQMGFLRLLSNPAIMGENAIDRSSPAGSQPPLVESPALMPALGPVLNLASFTGFDGSVPVRLEPAWVAGTGLALLFLAAAALTSQSLLTSRTTARWLRSGE
jgi:hypothetical protein